MRKTWKMLTFTALMCLCLGIAAACSGGETDNSAEAEPTAENVVIVLEAGIPENSLGKTGDVCLVAERGSLYRKAASGWEQADFKSYNAQGSTLTVTYSDGLTGSYAMAVAEEAGECPHTFEDAVTVYEPLCVVPGIGVKTCTLCHESFPVILPATGEHRYGADGYTCLDCGTADYFKDAELDTGGRYVIQNMRDVPFGDDGELVIPGEIDGHKVAIGEEAFGSFKNGQNKTLKSVVIGEGVEEIGGHAFQGCTELESVVFPESLTVLGADPDDGTILTNYYSIFEGCTSLKSVTFKGDITVIGNRTFYECSNLSSIELPDSLKEIGGEAFDATGLESITLPANVKLGSSVFSRCGKLSNVTFKGLVMGTGKDSARAIISSSCFNGCTSLAEITLPDGIVEIGSSAFQGCSALTGIEIPASLTAIDANAFQNCNLIASLTFGEGSMLKSIGSKAFYCGGNYMPANEKLQTVILPEGLETIEGDAFKYCQALQWVVLPSTLKTFKGFYAFDDCDLLEHLFYNGDSAAWGQITGVNSNATNIVCYFSDEQQTGFWHWEGDIPSIWG